MKSAVPAHKVLRLPQALQLKVLKVLRTKCRSCHETCYKEVLKVLCLPRNLHFQCTKCRSCHETCYWRCSKCCACHEICSSSGQSAAPATKSATRGDQSAAQATKSAVPVHKVLLLPRNLPLEMLKVLRGPRNLHIQIHIAQRCQGGLQWQAQLFVRDILFLLQINFLFDRI